MILSHPEHTRKCLKVEYLGRIEYDFQKSRVTGPWDHKDLVSAKKSIKRNFTLVYHLIDFMIIRSIIILRPCKRLKREREKMQTYSNTQKFKFNSKSKNLEKYRRRRKV
jgi:hypothetical protein